MTSQHVLPSRHTLPKLSVLGVAISPTSYQEVVALCRKWIDVRRASSASNTLSSAEPARYICVTSVHGVMTAQEDHAFRQILNEADVTTPDGMPLVWALRSFGMRSQQRVYGPTLMLRVCEQAAQAGHRIFLYGGRPETLPLLCEKLTDRFPELQIVGQYSPPFRSLTEHEEVSVRDAVERADPDIIFVGISTPKQENWMRSHRDAFSGRILIGVGAAFDFHAGRVKQAPSWMQRAGLEWLFRLLSEPARLWRRYLLVTPWFLPHWALQKSGLRKYPLS